MNLNRNPLLGVQTAPELGNWWTAIMSVIPKGESVRVAAPKTDYMPMILAGAVGLGALVLIYKS